MGLPGRRVGEPVVKAKRPPPRRARATSNRRSARRDPSQGRQPGELFKEITDLGTIEPSDAGCPADGLRRFKVLTTCDDNDLIDLFFTFHVAREQVSLSRRADGPGFDAGAPGSARPPSLPTPAMASSTTPPA